MGLGEITPMKGMGESGNELWMGYWRGGVGYLPAKNVKKKKGASGARRIVDNQYVYGVT